MLRPKCALLLSRQSRTSRIAHLGHKPPHPDSNMYEYYRCRALRIHGSPFINTATRLRTANDEVSTTTLAWEDVSLIAEKDWVALSPPLLITAPPKPKQQPLSLRKSNNHKKLTWRRFMGNLWWEAQQLWAWYVVGPISYARRVFLWFTKGSGKFKVKVLLSDPAYFMRKWLLLVVLTGMLGILYVLRSFVVCWRISSLIGIGYWARHYWKQAKHSTTEELGK
eukprot:PhF_6_TR39857/c0_g1_i4/m.59258